MYFTSAGLNWQAPAYNEKFFELHFSWTNIWKAREDLIIANGQHLRSKAFSSPEAFQYYLIKFNPFLEGEHSECFIDHVNESKGLNGLTSKIKENQWEPRLRADL